MEIRSLSGADLIDALRSGRRLAQQTRAASTSYALLFTLLGALIMAPLLMLGFAPFVLAAAGAFMLLGPAVLAGFFGIADAHEAGEAVRFTHALRGFSGASPGIWIIALVSVLLFMIFITDAAILYSYMVGRESIHLDELFPLKDGVFRFVLWGSVSGAFTAFLVYTISAFSVPLLCERRASMVTAIATSVRAVFGNFALTMLWAIFLSVLLIGSILLLPLFPFVLPWLAFAGRALYRQTLPLQTK